MKFPILSATVLVFSLVSCDRQSAPEPDAKNKPVDKPASPNPIPQTNASSAKKESGGKGLEELSSRITRSQLTDVDWEVLEAEINRDPAAAASWAATLPPGSNRDECLELIFASWAGTDSDAAIAFARRNLAGMDLTVAAASIAETLAEESPESAVVALSLVAEPLARGAVVESILRGSTSVDPNRAAQWVLATKEPGERRVAIGTLISEWASIDPVATAAWIDSHLSGEEKSGAAGLLIESWGGLSPRAAADWLAAHREGLDYELSGGVLANQWAMVDPKGAASWAMAEKDSGLRESLVVGLVGTWALNESSNAIQWAAEIPDAALRREALVAAFEAISEESPEALDVWMASNPNHPAMREASEVRRNAE